MDRNDPELLEMLLRESERRWGRLVERRLFSSYAKNAFMTIKYTKVGM